MPHAAVSSAVVPLDRKTPSRPMKSHPNTAPHPGKEAAVFTRSQTSIKQTGSWSHQVKGVWVPGVTHPVNVPTHHATDSQSRHHSSSRCCSHSRCHSRSATPNRDQTASLHDSTSWKWPVDPKPRPIQPIPMQSPPQKMH